MQLNELTNMFYNLLTLGNMLTLMFDLQKKKKNLSLMLNLQVDKVCPYKQR